MRAAKLIMPIALLLSCGQNDNQNSQDDKLGRSAPVTTGSAAFTKALAVLDAQCINCHTGFHASWKAHTSDKAWIDAGLIKAKDASGSSIIKKLINNGGNMPQGGSALSTGDLSALTEWINASS